MSIKEMSKNNKGFTLIEVMIVVAIIGIIAAIGYPSYTRYLHKAARAEASALLLEVMEKQEQYYRNKITYTDSLADLNYPATLETENGRFTISEMTPCANSTSIRRCVLVTATSQGNQPAGEFLALSSKGEKTGNWD